MPALCCQVSDQDCTSNVHEPPTSGVTQASYWSGTSGCLVIWTGGRRLPSGPVSTTCSELSWPSRNTVARTGNGSPTVALAG